MITKKNNFFSFFIVYFQNNHFIMLQKISIKYLVKNFHVQNAFFIINNNMNIKNFVLIFLPIFSAVLIFVKGIYFLIFENSVTRFCGGGGKI